MKMFISKSWKKVIVAEKIACVNNLVFNKIVRNNEIRRKYVIELVSATENTLV